MPIVDIEIVVDDAEELPPHLAQTLADELGVVFGASPGQTWVRLHKLPQEHYAEDGDALPQEVKPVFVTI